MNKRKGANKMTNWNHVAKDKARKNRMDILICVAATLGALLVSALLIMGALV